MASGALDAQGVWQYGEDDPVAPLSAFENLGQASVSSQFAADRSRLAALETANNGDVALGSFAPSFTNLTLGAGGSIKYAKWARKSNMVDVWVVVILGTGFTVGDIQFTLPIAPATGAMGARHKIGHCQLVDVSAGIAGQFEGVVVSNAPTTPTVCRLGYLTGAPLNFGQLSPGTPFNWAAGDEIHIMLRYPVA